MRRVCRLRGPPPGSFLFLSLFFFFFNSIWTISVCTDIISPACCAFSLCYPFQEELWEEEEEEEVEGWWSEVLFLVLTFFSVSCQVGPDGGFAGGIDRRLLL